MAIMSDRWIRSQCLPPSVPESLKVNGLEPPPLFRPMIEPFVDHQVRSIRIPTDRGFDDGHQTHAEFEEKKIVSYGLSSYGYDVRLGNKFKIFTNINNGVIDPLAMDEKCYIDYEGECCIIPPNSYVLGHTVEYFRIPRDIMVICVGKSTYARAGAIINVTPIEPEFEGQVVIEISNATNLPLKVHANQGIAQFLFLKGDVPCEVSYADRDGKYQGQTGVVTARI